VCPNIYFMGYSGVVRFGELRIGGLSGIWKPGDYRRGYTERVPYAGSDVKSAYHVREYDVWKLRQLTEPLDIFVSHDWPRGVARHGDTGPLFRAKPHLRDEVLDGSLGSQPNAELLAYLAPDYWFRRVLILAHRKLAHPALTRVSPRVSARSAHLHCKFPALVPRGGGRAGATRFLALDKCLPRRDFLQASGAVAFRAPAACICMRAPC
jgi:lariat debranching enzyme